MVLLISTQQFPEYEKKSLISSGSKDCRLLFLSSFLFFHYQIYGVLVSKWSKRKTAKEIRSFSVLLPTELGTFSLMN